MIGQLLWLSCANISLYSEVAEVHFASSLPYHLHLHELLTPTFMCDSLLKTAYTKSIISDWLEAIADGSIHYVSTYYAALLGASSFLFLTHDQIRDLHYLKMVLKALIWKL